MWLLQLVFNCAFGRILLRLLEGASGFCVLTGAQCTGKLDGHGRMSFVAATYDEIHSIIENAGDLLSYVEKERINKVKAEPTPTPESLTANAMTGCSYVSGAPVSNCC